MQERERDVWESFREEHFETIEQLPLSIHRQFILLRELDLQLRRYSADMSSTLQQYVSVRGPHDFANTGRLCDPRAETTPFYLLTNMEHHSSSMPAGLQSEAHAQTARLMPRSCTPSSSFAPFAPVPDRLNRHSTTSGYLLLTRIARLSEEILRASEEKVNLAQATCNSVKRHLYILDQAIREQTALLTAGLHPGTQLKSILPDLVVTRWTRPPRITLSPLPNLRNGTIDANGGASRGERVTISDIAKPGDSTGLLPRPSRSRKGNGKGLVKETIVQDGNLEPSHKNVVSPSLAPSLPPGTVIDPSEPRYCYCNQVSFGEMIGCDNKQCKREWFHLECVGLKESPNEIGEWYCRDCDRLDAGKRRR